MSIRISTLAAVTSLVMLVGCATGEETETEDATQTSESAEDNDEMQVEVKSDGVDTQGTGFTCGCPAGQEFSGAMCYPKCAAGYTGDGPVCWQTCAAGFTDTGFFCHRDSKVISSNHSSCPWYNKCGLGSRADQYAAG